MMGRITFVSLCFQEYLDTFNGFICVKVVGRNEKSWNSYKSKDGPIFRSSAYNVEKNIQGHPCQKSCSLQK